MRVKIVRQPTGSIHGVALKHYKPPLVYDLPSSLADYLVASGMAVFDMRIDTRSQPPEGKERRLPKR